MNLLNRSNLSMIYSVCVMVVFNSFSLFDLFTGLHKYIYLLFCAMTSGRHWQCIDCCHYCDFYFISCLEL